ncbi:unnamed protein product [Auanema sp. JU1783]|nr:unnamed protein product [Auanema sp. JU1783]
MTEEDEEPAASSSSSTLDWKKIFELAQDPDIEELLLGPIESAIKTLEEGKEVQKIHVIRNLPSLLESHGDEAIESVIPAIQNTLKEERENFDIHCEAAVVFKAILQNDSICNSLPGLAHVLLKNILDNISPPKEPGSENRVVVHIGDGPQVRNLSIAAWLETLVDIADRVSTDAQKQYIIPIVQQQADPSQRVQRRVIATKLLHKLAEILPPSEVRKELASVAQTLSHDPNSTVRTAMAQRLPVMAKALKNSTDCVSLLLPCLVQLCNDDDCLVKEASFNNLSQWFPFLTKEIKRTTIFPLIKKSIEQSIDKFDDLLMTLTKNLGEWVFLLMENLDQLDLSWVLNTYLRVCNLVMKTSESKSDSLTLMCRRMCAYNIPCFVELFPKAFDKILPVFTSFCHDADVDVRLSMAASFHEIVTRRPERDELLTPFIELIRGGSLEVVGKIAYHMDKYLPILYKLTKSPKPKVSQIQLDRLLVGCNQLLRGSGAWRAHEALLKHLSILTNVLSYKQLFDTFIPFLQKEVLTVRAIPCRKAAASTLLLFMRQNPDKKERENVINYLKKEIGEHTCSYRRSLFIDIAQIVLEMFSRQFFIEYFLIDLLKMTDDSNANIRLKAIRLLPIVKTNLLLPDDDTTLVDLEKAVRSTLSNEKQNFTRQLMQNAACDLSRNDSLQKENLSNQKRLEEEKQLWSEKRKTPVEDENVKSPSPPEEIKVDKLTISQYSRSISPSPWKQQRKTIAVVRPQPVVVFRSASPVPKIFDGGRPSRLPLSTANRDRDVLKKTVTDLPTPRSSRIRSTMTMSQEGPSSVTPSSPTSYGLRRSATTSTFGSSIISHSHALSSSRSSSCLRRPTYGLSRVSSHSTFERKPPQLSLRVKES